MLRREVIILIVGAPTVWQLGARAQQKAMPVIGWLSSASPGQRAGIFAAFDQGLRESGWVEGQNVAIEYCSVERYDRLPDFIADLVGSGVDVIATSGMPSTLAAKSATSTIPIVFFIGTDPVAVGLVASLARPGGNLTGITIMATELMPKRLELLSDLVPQAGLIGLLVNPNNASTEPHRHMASSRHLRRKDPQRRQAGRSAGPATDHLRAGR